jgi:ribosomal protein S18 acetylase RimI-like enzyme
MDSLPYKILEFDTNLFGYKVCKITKFPNNQRELEKTLGKLKKERVKLIYCATSARNDNNLIKRLCSKNGYGFYEENRFVFVCDIKHSTLYSLDSNIHSYLYSGVNSKLLSLAFKAGKYSRFFRDKNFGNEFFKLYRTWILRSLSGEIAVDVGVYKKDGNECGLITLEKENGFGKIGLISVDDKFQGLGIGSRLVDYALKKFRENGLYKVKVVTQEANKKACKFYKRKGFVVKETISFYHIWLK